MEGAIYIAGGSALHRWRERSTSLGSWGGRLRGAGAIHIEGQRSISLRGERSISLRLCLAFSRFGSRARGLHGRWAAAIEGAADWVSCRV